MRRKKMLAPWMRLNMHITMHNCIKNIYQTSDVSNVIVHELAGKRVNVYVCALSPLPIVFLLAKKYYLVRILFDL